MEEYGIVFVMFVLLVVGKWFDYCLVDGVILGHCPFYYGRCSELKVFKYLWYLWDCIFDDEGVFRENLDYIVIFFLR